MKKKFGIFFVAFVISSLMMCASASADSVSDPSGDVYHWKASDSGFKWDLSIDSKPNIDITELSYSIVGEQLTLSMEVSGTIQTSEKIVYIAWMNVSNAYYWLSWTNGQSTSIAMNTDEGSVDFDIDPEVTVSEDTLSATFDVISTDTTTTQFWGYAAEYTVLNDMTNEWWGDWAPAEFAPYYSEETGDDDTGDDDTGDDNTGDEGNGGEADGNTNGDTPPPQTPGFEMLLLLAAFVFVIFYLRRK